MREYLPEAAVGNRGVVEVADDATVGDVIDALGAPRRLVFSLLVDGAQANVQEQVHEGAEVTVMPPFTGGASR
jgi:molybdopterin converting factor small subunit